MPKHQHTFENSTAIAAIEWEGDGTNGTLGVRFTSGAFHQYRDVPREVFESMKKAPSAGSYFHKCVRSVFVAV